MNANLNNLFIEVSMNADPIPGYESLALYNTRKAAVAAVKLIGWPNNSAVRARGRFQVLWGIYNSGQGYLTETGYNTLLSRRTRS